MMLLRPQLVVLLALVAVSTSLRRHSKRSDASYATSTNNTAAHAVTGPSCRCLFPWQSECHDQRECYDWCTERYVQPCTKKTRCTQTISGMECQCANCEGYTKFDQEYLDACAGQCPEGEMCYRNGWKWYAPNDRAQIAQIPSNMTKGIKCACDMIHVAWRGLYICKDTDEPVAKWPPLQEE